MSSFDNMSAVPVITPVMMRSLINRSTTSRTSWKLWWSKFQSVCVILFYLACIVRLPARTMAAPIPKAEAKLVIGDHEQDFDDHEDSLDQRLKDPPYWINPCGTNMDDALEFAPSGKNADAPGATKQSDDEVIISTKLAIELAIKHFDSFKEDYTEKLFHQSWDVLDETWRHVQIPWLPVDNVLNEDAQTKDFPTALKSLYLAFQQVAMSLEQTIFDSAIDRDQFYLPLQQTEYKVQNVLCELQATLLEKAITPEPAPERSLMTDQYRAAKDASTRNFRDFLILNHYYNLLKFSMDYFEQLEKSSHA